MSSKKIDFSQKDVHIIKVDPATAQQWLLRNTGNRPISHRVVQFYLDEMRAGKWGSSTDAIGFTKAGRMINGQHRLTALVKSGKSFEFLVETGMSEQDFSHIDTGKVRVAGDVLGTRGFTAPHHQAAICRFVMSYKKGKVLAMKEGKRDTNLTNEMILEFAEKNRDKLEETYKISSRVTHKMKAGLRGREIGGLYWLFSEIDRESAMSFFHFFSTGENLAADSPIYAVRQKFIQSMGARKQFPTRDKIAWMIIAWNKFRKNGKMTQVRWNGEEFPKPI